MSSIIDIESKINSNINDPNFGDIKQFKLIVKTNKNIYSFFKKTEEKYCQLINIEIININHVINKKNMDTKDCYIYKDQEIYIEFLQENNYTNCYCYYKKLNNNKLFNTPPNY